MKQRRISLLVAALALPSPSPSAVAIPPPLPEFHDYYGPLRACGGFYAFDVRYGEGYGHGGGPPLRLLWPGGGMSFELFIYEFERDRDIVHPLEAINLADGIQLQRIRMTSRNSPAVEILYLYEIPQSSYFRFLSIRSSAFDGSERDRPILERIAFGEAARALCASVPDALRATAERENRDAQWADRREFSGPLTVCMAGLAFGVVAGETLTLPWIARSTPRFRIASGGRRTEIDLHQWLPFDSPPPPGSLAASAAVEMVEGRVGIGYQFAPDEPEGPRQVLLVQRDPNGRRPLATMPMARLAFDPTIGREERLAIARRLRLPGPNETCFEPPPLPATEIGAVTRDGQR